MRANYVVRDCQTKKMVNFYSAEYPRASFFAHECKRDMKAMSGREHEVVLEVEGYEHPMTEEEYNGLANKED